MTPFIELASDRKINLPMFDPIVSAHFQNPNSNTETLLSEINDREIYSPLFKGKKNLTFLDIGANIGLVSIYASDSCSRIVAVEPSPETFKVLRALTHQFPQIECAQAALAPKDGPCEFFINSINTTASSVINTFGEFTHVNGLTLSSILRIYQLEHVDVCKVDIEGLEDLSLNWEELKGAAPIIDAWHVEVHNCPKSTWEDKLESLSGRFLSAGYEVSVTGMTITASK